MRRHRLPGWLTFSAAAVALGTAQQQITPDVVVSDAYHSPNFGEIRLLGVCDVRSDSLECWDLNRTVDKDLGHRVSEVLRKWGGGQGGTGAVLPFHFHRKNRLAVFQVPTTTLQLDAASSFNGFGRQFGPYGYASTPFVLTTGPVATELLPIEAAKDATTTSVAANLLLQVGRPFDVDLRRGASASGGGMSVLIDSISEAKQRKNPPITQLGKGNYVGPDNSPRPIFWTVLLKISGDGPTSGFQMEVEPLDRNGSVITWVDRYGKPKDPRTGKAPYFHGKGVSVETGGYGFYANSNEYIPESRTRTWKLGVDPKYVSRLRFTFKSPTTVDFKDIPLDPNKSLRSSE